ncbi:MAG: GNAT family N-acetyltransferase [Pseudomonas sp.]|uniref:GNAT family N-acetyltransferase n=1 Tax=Pseudomonas sp. TaxID=306 RepID=UPI0033984920
MRLLSGAARVRRAQPADVPALLVLMRELAAFEDYLEAFALDEPALLERALGPQAQCQVFVAEWADGLCGYAVVLEIPFTYDLRPRVVLKELYVAPQARGTGVGTTLLREVARWANSRGAGQMEWTVLRGNGRAETFYRRLGGRPDSKWIAYRMDANGLAALAEQA